MKKSKSISTVLSLLNIELELFQNKLEKKEETYDNHQDKMPENPRNDSWENRNNILEEEIDNLQSVIDAIETFIEEMEGVFNDE